MIQSASQAAAFPCQLGHRGKVGIIFRLRVGLLFLLYSCHPCHACVRAKTPSLAGTRVLQLSSSGLVPAREALPLQSAISWCSLGRWDAAPSQGSPVGGGDSSQRQFTPHLGRLPGNVSPLWAEKVSPGQSFLPKSFLPAKRQAHHFPKEVGTFILSFQVKAERRGQEPLRGVVVTSCAPRACLAEEAAAPDHPRSPLGH